MSLDFSHMFTGKTTLISMKAGNRLIHVTAEQCIAEVRGQPAEVCSLLSTMYVPEINHRLSGLLASIYTY